MWVLRRNNDLTFDLFFWWAATITGGIAILIAVSIYLYTSGRTICKENGKATARKTNPAKDFIFVWVLLGLLVFYIISVNIGSSLVFAVGNIAVEILLIAYLVRSGRRKLQEATPSETQETAKSPK